MSRSEGQYTRPPGEDEALRSKLAHEEAFDNDRDDDHEQMESRRLPDSVARFTVIQPDPSARNGNAQPLKEAIIVTFDDKYLKTCGGVLRVIHVLCAVVSLLCLVTSGTKQQHFMELPMHSELRIFIFIAILGFLSSLLVLIINVTGLYKAFPLDRRLMDMIVYFINSILFILGPSLVAQDIIRYHRYYPNITHWTYQQLIASVLLGYTCMLIAVSITIIAFRKYKGYTLFNRRRLQGASSLE
ncbi:PREDICTED: uncharacterized protein LOC106810250 [Priapulus caudatus]|uniref:Uncharacterized protein LOC106810250 n=1 Tax=Priapulus caudatus TaxID=37621 RepID=A0ABM1EA06_PRICU|nr:PREDICTED: uncharacterized protein LOC106810250 [Priapulus caudatus]